MLAVLEAIKNTAQAIPAGDWAVIATISGWGLGVTWKVSAWKSATDTLIAELTRRVRDLEGGD